MRSSRFGVVLAFWLALCFALPALAQTTFDHAPWDAALKVAVKDGRVDYAALSRDPRVAEYVGRLAAFDPAQLPTREARLAFWLNAYNVLAVSGVLAHYPGLKSVSDVAPDFGFFKAQSYKVGGKALSLNDIENDIVRKTFADARVHAALNCASTSCPPLRAEAFQPETLERQLDEQMRRFVRDASRNRIVAATGEVRLSSIFDWYKDDFKGVGAFVSRYLDAPEAAAVLAAEKAGKLGFLPYDWSLNGR
jgi:hypothetical protein